VSRLRLQLVAAALFLLAWTQSSALEPKREAGILPIDPPTPYVHYLPEGALRGRVLAVHGLDVSKEVMTIISAALADGGFEVYTIDLPGHGD
jgi:alpha-beta hydrolase superfamily lysophospholipase